MFRALFRKPRDHPGIERDLAEIKASLIILATQGAKHMAQLDALTAEVARNTALTAAVLAKIEELKANGNNPAEVQALTDGLKANNDTLAAVVTP